MFKRATRLLAVLVPLLAVPGITHAQHATRTIETTQDADYFGFDLRTERDVSLEQCKSICLADGDCRAFTFNTRAQWCFLKSDYSTINTFAGAVAGRVIDVASDPEIGAPPALSFVPEHMRDEARRYRATILQTGPQSDIGAVHLAAQGTGALEAGDAATALQNFAAAAAISRENASLWANLARSNLAFDAESGMERAKFARNGTSAALISYDLARTVADRADSLAVLAEGLDRRELYRPALHAYEASLLLVNNVAVRAAYSDLRSRRGFRVVGHTVDADVATPRICVQFSEDLSKSVDYSSYVTVDEKAPAAIDVSGKQICVEGLQHGNHYRVAIRQGLPAAISEATEIPVALSVYIRDRATTVRFSGENFVLPSTGRHGIPLVSVNAPTADLKLHRIGDRSLASLMSGSQFLRQLDGYDIGSIADTSGELVWEGAIELTSELNKETVTSFPVSEALPKREPGVYVLTAIPQGDQSESWNAKATQWFVVSDIGLATFAGEDGLTVFSRSLATAKPLAGVELQLLARNNEILGTATTNDQGQAVFTAGLMRGTASLAPAVLTATGENADFVFLDMTRAGFDLSDRGVTGRPAPGALDIFSWTERGIYRPGETVHASALARDDSTTAVEALPLTFIFTRPDGVEERRVVSYGEALGGHFVSLDLQPTAMLGAWNINIHTDPNAAAISQSTFLVEQFVPDRIEFDLTAQTPEISPDETAQLSVDGRFLYGAPASGLALEGEIGLKVTREWDRFPGYHFGLADEEVEAVAIPLDLDPVDEAGRSTFSAPIDALPYTTALLEAQVTVRMRETGGRAVERRTTVKIRPEESVIGIRPDAAGEEIRENSNAGFRIMAVSPEGQREALRGARWTLTKLERNYQWYRSDNAWSYEAIETESRVDGGSVDIGTDEPASLSVPVEWGRYRLDVEGTGASGPVASYVFNAGWFVEATSTETPDGLEIALDKDSYQAGDTARLKISPRFAGELLVTVGSERLLSTINASVPETGSEIEIPVTGEWGGGAYVTAVLYRPGDAQESRMPARAIGIKWLSIDPGARKLDVSLDTPEQAAPRETLTIPVSIAGLSAGEEAYVSVAAVDVGILNLTRYEPPNPENWYFGQRRLGLELRDLYGRLIDGSAGRFGRLRTGGDGGSLSSQGSPPTEKLLAFFSGPVSVGDDGTATVSFDLPEFNGTARVMAVAWSKTAVGNASADVVIRDPVVLTAAQPRFLAAGDQATIRLDIHNTDGPTGDYALSIDTQGTADLSFGSVPVSVSLNENQRAAVLVPVSALTTGDATVTIALSHNNGMRIERNVYLPVRQPAMPTTSRQIVSIPAGGSLRIDEQLLSASLLDGASVALGVSPLAALDIPSLLTTLDRYPYGCTEQTISRAMPLLYVSELSAISGMEDDPDLRKRVQDAIGRVMSAQTSSGTFGLWGPGFGDMWLDAYVTDFLTRAREAGYAVPAQGLTMALTNLQNQMSYTTDVQARGAEMAYALYVMARNRKASAGDLRYYADARIEEFSGPMARAQIAAALALYGDTQRSERAFASALRQAQSNSNDDFNRSDYGSRLRDGAAILGLAAESRPAPAVIPAMVRFVAEERASKTYTSTQEQVWMVLAARALGEAGNAIKLDVGGQSHEGNFSRRMDGRNLEREPLVVANRGREAVDAVITTVAAAADPLPAGGDGFDISRTYYTLDGEEANIIEARQNERFVVVLQVDQWNDWQARVAITDLLPAGFEIDNPRLVGSAELQNFEWLGEAEAAHSEFQADRFVAAFDRTGSGSFTAAYVVRAVTPGIYSHPAAVVEDMYRPQFNARSAAGMMEVVAAQ